MSDVEWNNESVLRLIAEYKACRELWDRGHELYRAQTAKYDAWASLARTFECDIADLRKKINSIFASYRREKCKIREGRTSTWFLYHHLSFLNNHIDQPSINARRRRSTSPDNQMDEDQTSDEHDADDYGSQSEVIVKSEPATVEYVSAKSLPPLKNCKRLKRTIRRKVFKEHNSAPTNNTNQIDSKLLEMLRLLRKSNDISKKKDECDSFGEYIAVSLRKHDERTQSMIKQAINNILFEQEMKKYSAGQYVVISDDNPLVLGETDAVTS